MFKYLKQKDGSLVVNDPIYGKITVQEPYASIVLTKEMYRLKDISQNGFSCYEFPNLENNDRLSHSVGTFYVMSLILEHLEEVLKPYHIEISQDDKEVALCSMLIHDIGHGPRSHSLEVVVDYPHEKRTTDILLGDTEIHHLLFNLFGEKKLKKIASFIDDINEVEEDFQKDSFTKLLKNLVSHQLDADRLDYLTRDAYYVGMFSPIDLKRIISNLNVVVNNNQEYELVIHRNALSCAENVLIHRYQMYRDVYLSPISVLGDELFRLILKRYQENSELHSLPLSKTFRLIAKGNNIALSDFLEMKDLDLTKDYEILKNNAIDPVIAYLCNIDHLKDYFLLEEGIPLDQIKRVFREVFGECFLEEHSGILKIDTKNILYKNEQRLNIQSNNRICDITECTNLIRPQEILKNSYVFVNPVLYQLESGKTLKEGEKEYMLEQLDKKPVEFELKYLCDTSFSKKEVMNHIISLMQENGYRMVSQSVKENCDDYFDSKDYQLYSEGASLRTRQTTHQGQKKNQGTFKKPLGENQVYSSRNEMEVPLFVPNFEQLKQEMNSQVDCDFELIEEHPVVNSTTNRTDILFEKDGFSVCVSLDDTVYTNYWLYGTMAMDRMIEIESKGKVVNRVMLNEIHDFISRGMPNLSVTTESKYRRGVKKTYNEYVTFMSKYLELEHDPKLTPSLRKIMKEKEE